MFPTTSTLDTISRVGSALKTCFRVYTGRNLRHFLGAMSVYVARKSGCRVLGLETTFLCHKENAKVYKTTLASFYFEWGINSVVEWSLCMRQAPGSNPGFSKFFARPNNGVFLCM